MTFPILRPPNYYPMKDSIKFSIVVPIYNMELYLRRCIDSILCQEYDNFELICVNDGSKDNSLQIIEEYANKDQRVVIIDQPNGGLGSARNRGIERASGDYVWFVDSDDWICNSALSILNQYIERTGYLNAYIIDMIQIDDNSNKHIIRSCSREQGELSSTRYAEDLLLFNALFYAQNKIYKYEYIKDFRFRKGFYEDVPQIVQFAKNDCCIYIVHEPLYFYYTRPGSIMHTVDRRSLGIFNQIDYIYDELYSFKEYRLFCTYLFYYALSRTYRMLTKTGSEELLSDFSNMFKERRRKYNNPLSLLFFRELTVRRKVSLVVGIKDFIFI